jgi:acetyltransferase-like isoleucine patch superfamily enzyme
VNAPIVRRSGIRDVEFGENVVVVEPTNMYECVIGSGCVIGPYCEIQSNVVVGARTKIQSHTFICSLVEIGQDVFIGHGVMFVNDLFQKGGPAKGDTSKWRHTKVGNRVAIGSNATILPVEIEDGCVIGAGAVVTRDLRIAGIYAGNPARLLRKI